MKQFIFFSSLWLEVQVLTGFPGSKIWHLRLTSCCCVCAVPRKLLICCHIKWHCSGCAPSAISMLCHIFMLCFCSVTIVFGAPVIDERTFVSAHSWAFLVHKMRVVVFWVITPYDL
jgi:hypothetical protein